MNDAEKTERKIGSRLESKPGTQACRILVLGATGQVGQSLAAACPGDFVFHGVSRRTLDLEDVDRLASRLDALIDEIEPHFVVNAAAYTAVDQAQTDIEAAYAANAVAPGVLAGVAARRGVALVHYSTDYVFDGHQATPYIESDAVQPLSVYGRSKLLGERAIEAVADRALVLRTSWVFSEFGRNFLKTMLHLAASRETLQVVNDQIGAPTSAHWIARITYDIMRTLRHADKQDQRWRCYHLSAAGEISWHGYADYLIAQARTLGFEVQTRVDGVSPIPGSGYPTPAPRPLSSRLDTSLLRDTFGVQTPDWREGVDEVLMALRCGH